MICLIVIEVKKSLLINNFRTKYNGDINIFDNSLLIKFNLHINFNLYYNYRAL